jgi:hypothetical protein
MMAEACPYNQRGSQTARETGTKLEVIASQLPRPPLKNECPNSIAVAAQDGYTVFLYCLT